HGCLPRTNCSHHPISPRPYLAISAQADEPSFVAPSDLLSVGAMRWAAVADVRSPLPLGRARPYIGRMTQRRDLFPPIEPYRTGQLRLDSPHVMYWEESGNLEGPAVLFLHGGPGAGATAVHRRFFDPGHWHIVIFDQRGAGRSTPLGEVTDNTPSH